jgi:hypothetical protein
MKLRHTVALPDRHPCQRPGCPNIELRDAGTGKPRFQSRHGDMRTLILCDECFERLRADQLRDLFLCFGVPVGSSERPRREAVRSIVSRPS